MKKIILLATLVLNLFMFNAQADDTDFRTWMNWNVSYNATDKLDIKGGLEYRTKNNASATDVWAFKAETNYKLLPFLKAGVGYEFHLKHKTPPLQPLAQRIVDRWPLRPLAARTLPAHHQRPQRIPPPHTCTGKIQSQRLAETLRLHRNVQQPAPRRQLQDNPHALPCRNGAENSQKRHHRSLLSLSKAARQSLQHHRHRHQFQVLRAHIIPPAAGYFNVSNCTNEQAYEENLIYLFHMPSYFEVHLFL